MAEHGMKLTRAGLLILAKGLSGKNIIFTKCKLGAGDFDYDSESVLDLTDLKDIRLEMPIVGKEITGDGTVTITARLCNLELEQGFQAKEHGVYCEDPDTHEEVLYAYRNTGEEYSFIPAGFGVTKIDVRKAYVVEIGNAENLIFNIDFDFAYCSQAEHDEMFDYFGQMFRLHMIPQPEIIDKILAGTYQNIGGSGIGEKLGVPTSEDIDNILAGRYVEHYIETDKYAVDVPTENDIDKILRSIY